MLICEICENLNKFITEHNIPGLIVACTNSKPTVEEEEKNNYSLRRFKSINRCCYSRITNNIKLGLPFEEHECKSKDRHLIEERKPDSKDYPGRIICFDCFCKVGGNIPEIDKQMDEWRKSRNIKPIPLPESLASLLLDVKNKNFMENIKKL